MLRVEREMIGTMGGGSVQAVRLLWPQGSPKGYSTILLVSHQIDAAICGD